MNHLDAPVDIELSEDVYGRPILTRASLEALMTEQRADDRRVVMIRWPALYERTVGALVHNDPGLDPAKNGAAHAV